MKTRTCKRCNGTGNKQTAVAHLGVAGLCFACDGSGMQKFVDAAIVTADRAAARAKHVAQVEKEIAECREALASSGNASDRRFWQRELQRQQETLASIKPVETATAGEWRAA